MRNFFEEINFIKKCKKYHLPFWQCPHFVSLLMGLVIILAIIFTYLVGTRLIEDPLIVALIVLFFAGFLLILDYLIVQSFERLALVSQMRADFVSIASHQMKAPLLNLKWSLEALERKGIKIEKDYFKILKENIERMGRLIQDLLIVAKIEEKKLKAKKEKFSLKELLEKVIGDFSLEIKKRKIKIFFESKKNLPLVFGDKNQIQKVIENLLSNALAYTKKGGKIEIFLFLKGKKLIFQIKDNGIGIPKKEQKYIFEKFFRAENARKIKKQGTGLGLFIAKSMLKENKGKIWFKSKENKGSSFFFSLPIS